MIEPSQGELRPVLADLTDAELSARILGRDAQALALAYQRHGSRVIAVANAILQDRTAAEDVCQDVFIHLWHHPEKFDGGRGTLRAYLVVVSHGRALDRRRSEQARARREKQHGGFPPSRKDGPDDQAIASLTATQIWAAVSSLPVHEADALRLAYFSGTTYREVARMLDLAEGTVKSRIRSGLMRLRATLDEQGIISAT